MVPLPGCFLEEAREICQFLGGSCESLMGSNTRIGREKEKKPENQHTENNSRSQQNIHLRGRKSHFSIIHTWGRCRVVERTQTLEFERGVFPHCTLIGVALGESLNFVSVSSSVKWGWVPVVHIERNNPGKGA